jgi:hypothetical protein
MISSSPWVVMIYAAVQQHKLGAPGRPIAPVVLQRRWQLRDEALEQNT